MPGKHNVSSDSSTCQRNFDFPEEPYFSCGTFVRLRHSQAARLEYIYIASILEVATALWFMTHPLIPFTQEATVSAGVLNRISCPPLPPPLFRDPSSSISVHRLRQYRYTMTVLTTLVGNITRPRQISSLSEISIVNDISLIGGISLIGEVSPVGKLITRMICWQIT